MRNKFSTDFRQLLLTSSYVNNILEACKMQLNVEEQHNGNPPRVHDWGDEEIFHLLGNHDLM
jgi:hypothetical protein